MEEAPENGKELSHSAHANGMNEPSANSYICPIFEQDELHWRRNKAFTFATHEESFPLQFWQTAPMEHVNLEPWLIAFPKAVPPTICTHIYPRHARSIGTSKSKDVSLTTFELWTIFWHAVLSLRLPPHTAINWQWSSMTETCPTYRKWITLLNSS